MQEDYTCRSPVWSEAQKITSDDKPYHVEPLPLANLHARCPLNKQLKHTAFKNTGFGLFLPAFLSERIWLSVILSRRKKKVTWQQLCSFHVMSLDMFCQRTRLRRCTSSGWHPLVIWLVISNQCSTDICQSGISGFPPTRLIVLKCGLLSLKKCPVQNFVR